jgi:hypothetical protein
MDKIGYIEIKVSGSKGNLNLTPDNYDIREIIAILQNAENLLFPSEKKDRPTISYKIEEGSVKHIFKTSIQYIIGFNAIIAQIQQQQNIDFLDLPTAQAIENIQDIARKKDYVFTISTSIDKSNELRVDANTHFYRTEADWVDAEFYFYGKIIDAGGKNKTNIHIHTQEYGVIKISTPVAFFEQLEENIIHKKTYGIRVKGKQNSVTGEFDKDSFEYLELIPYEKKYDEAYLNSLIEKATKNWAQIKDKDAWLHQIRGNYDA